MSLRPAFCVDARTASACLGRTSPDKSFVLPRPSRVGLLKSPATLHLAWALGRVLEYSFKGDTRMRKQCRVRLGWRFPEYGWVISEVQAHTGRFQGSPEIPRAGGKEGLARACPPGS